LGESRARDWLEQVTEGAVFYRLNRGVHARLAGHQHDGKVEMALAHFAQERDAVHVRHRDVAEQSIELTLT
jgi:hypothetical protein